MIRCWFRWFHEYGWPVNGIQTCTRCGRTRKAEIEFGGNPRFAVPRSAPRLLTEEETENVVPIRKRKRATR